MVVLSLKDSISQFLKKLCNHVTVIIVSAGNKGFTRGYICYGIDVTTYNHVTTFSPFFI